MLLAPPPMRATPLSPPAFPAIFLRPSCSASASSALSASLPFSLFVQRTYPANREIRMPMKMDRPTKKGPLSSWPVGGYRRGTYYVSVLSPVTKTRPTLPLHKPKRRAPAGCLVSGSPRSSIAPQLGRLASPRGRQMDDASDNEG